MQKIKNTKYKRKILLKIKTKNTKENITKDKK